MTLRYRKRTELVRSALKIIKEMYNKTHISLDKMFGVRKAKQIAKRARTASNFASVEKLMKSDEALELMWNEFSFLLPDKRDSTIVSMIADMFINERPIIRSKEQRKHYRSFKELMKIDPLTGEIELPTTRWTNNGEKIDTKARYDSLPKAIRSAQHTIDSLVKEYEENKQLIERIDKIIRYLPRLGKGSTDEERRLFRREVLRLAGELSKKRHALKVEARKKLVADDETDVINLLETSNDPERIRYRRERNWPAASARLVAARRRLFLRNIEIVEQLTPGMEVRKEKLLSAYDDYSALHRQIDEVVGRYVNLIHLIFEHGWSPNLQKRQRRCAKEVIDLINDWLVPYLHSTDYDRVFWEIGKHLLDSVRALNKGNLQTALDEVLTARRLQTAHYQTVLVDKEGKGII